MPYTMSDARKRQDVAQSNWEKRLQVLTLRNQGLEFEEIGKTIGISKQAANKLYLKTKDMSVEDVEKLLQVGS